MTTLSKYQERGQTLSFGLKKSAKLFKGEEIQKIPFFCPICSFAISNNIDVEAYLRVECCRDCESDFAEVNLKKWREGHRPTEDEVSKKKFERQALLLQRYVVTENKK